jgi:class 3 adenylate cyclase
MKKADETVDLFEQASKRVVEEKDAKIAELERKLAKMELLLANPVVTKVAEEVEPEVVTKVAEEVVTKMAEEVEPEVVTTVAEEVVTTVAEKKPKPKSNLTFTQIFEKHILGNAARTKELNRYSNYDMRRSSMINFAREIAKIFNNADEEVIKTAANKFLIMWDDYKYKKDSERANKAAATKRANMLI